MPSIRLQIYSFLPKIATLIRFIFWLSSLFMFFLFCLGNADLLFRMNENVGFHPSISCHGIARASSAVLIWLYEIVAKSATIYTEIYIVFLRPTMPSVANTPFSCIFRNRLIVSYLSFFWVVCSSTFRIPHCEKACFEGRNMANGTAIDGLSRLG